MFLHNIGCTSNDLQRKFDIEMKIYFSIASKLNYESQKSEESEEKYELFTQKPGECAVKRSFGLVFDSLTFARHVGVLYAGS